MISAPDMANERFPCRLPSSGRIWCFLISFENQIFPYFFTSNSGCQVEDGKDLSFFLLKNGEDTGIRFRGVPNGHEFTSLLLAILNADGKGKNIPDEAVGQRIQALKGDIRLTTYVSLTCTNFKEILTTNRFGEIETDTYCRTNQPGIYAAGDVTTTPYKQIIISMGEGTKAALSAFDDRIRG